MYILNVSSDSFTAISVVCLGCSLCFYCCVPYMNSWKWLPWRLISSPHLPTIIFSICSHMYAIYIILHIYLCVCVCARASLYLCLCTCLEIYRPIVQHIFMYPIILLYTLFMVCKAACLLFMMAQHVSPHVMGHTKTSAWVRYTIRILKITC